MLKQTQRNTHLFVKMNMCSNTGKRTYSRIRTHIYLQLSAVIGKRVGVRLDTVGMVTNTNAGWYRQGYRYRVDAGCYKYGVTRKVPQ